MTALGDDCEPNVRRALAEALAGARGAPRALVVALVNDASRVAAPLLARSPILTDVELAECAAVGDSVAQELIARRPAVGEAPADALAEKGSRDAVAALLGNCGARLSQKALLRIRERFAEDEGIKDAILARGETSASFKAELLREKAQAFVASLSDAPGRERAAREAIDRRDAALVSVAATCRRTDLGAFVRTLRERAALTTTLLLRAALSGEREMFAMALAELAGISPARAAELTRARSEGVAALMAKAGLPAHAAPAFRAALAALDAHSADDGEGLRPDLVSATIAACEARNDPALAPVVALLWRFAAEAARVEAREIVVPRADPPQRLPSKLTFSPANDADPPLLIAAAIAAKRRAA
ncbi:MAG: DUF2336 domain-containing protein [Acetobacteraceae bacterium]|nr:DUF2336 domain-containing protein [Acetobacteraceae bacterium]